MPTVQKPARLKNPSSGSEQPTPTKTPRAATAKSSGPRPTPRTTPSPTRIIQPGREHVKIAEILLKRIQASALAKGIQLDVGEFPPYSDSVAGVLTGTKGEENAAALSDPQRPVRILSHAVARAADRLPFTRKLSRHMEGSEARSGIISDLIAEAVELYARNTDEVEKLLREYLSATSQRIQRRKATEQQETPANGNGKGVKHHAAR